MRSTLRRIGVLALVVLLATVLLLGTPAASGQDGVPSDPGLELRHTEQLSPRLSELLVFSPAMERALSVRVLTPVGFDPTVDRLPVLWLLHGGFGSAEDWTTSGEAEALTAGLDVVVVMPDAGTGGWYTDWLHETEEGPQQWETFHLRELRPFIEDRYNTRTDRGGRAVAGLSMGGFGAMKYAARHPDLFGFAASFSGAVDLFHPGVMAIVLISPFAHLGLPFDLFGSPVPSGSRWRANNPVDLAANLRTVEVQLRTGNGTPGGPHGGAVDVGEAGVSQANATLHRRLDELGIDHVYDDYGPGNHSWAYWQDGLRKTLPAMIAAFARSHASPHVAPRAEATVRPILPTGHTSLLDTLLGAVGTGEGPRRLGPHQRFTG